MGAKRKKPTRRGQCEYELCRREVDLALAQGQPPAPAGGAASSSRSAIASTDPLMDNPLMFFQQFNYTDRISWLGWRATRVITMTCRLGLVEWNALLQEKVKQVDLAPFEFSAMVRLTADSGSDFAHSISKIVPQSPALGMLMVPKANTLKDWVRGAICQASDPRCLGSPKQEAWYFTSGWSPWRSGKVRWMNTREPENGDYYKIGDGDGDGNSDDDGAVHRSWDVQRWFVKPKNWGDGSVCHVNHAHIATWEAVIEEWQWAVWNRCKEYLRSVGGNPDEAYWMYQTAVEIEEDGALWN